MNDKTDPGAKPRQKIRLDQMKGLQTDSIAIRFNASSFKDEDDDEDLFANTSRSSSNEALKFVMKEQSPTEETMQLPAVNHGRSFSAPVSEVTTPSKPEAFPPAPIIANNNSVPTRLSDKGKEATVVAPFKEEAPFERSFMSGIRERLQEPLSSIRDRIEVLKTESPLVESIERRLRKTDSLDSSSENRNSSRLLGLKAQSRLHRTRHGSLDLEGPTSPSESGTVPNDLNGLAEKDVESTPKSVPKSMSSDSIDRARIQPISRKELQLLSDPNDQSPMSLSNLLAKSDSHQAIAEETSEFFDPEEDVNEVLDGVLKVEEEPLLETEDSDEASAPELPVMKPNIPLKHRVVAALVAFLAYVAIPLPDYISGMVTGVTLASLLIWLYFTYYAQPASKRDLLLPRSKTLPPLKVPEMRESTNVDNNFKGWMNQLSKYNVESYHISHTLSTFVTLEGSHLRLQTPKQNISRQALHDDCFAPSTFVHQRFFDLSNAQVFLLPTGLIKKRLWSKKYPICILPSRNSRNTDTPNGTEDSSSNSEEVQIFLFGRTCREKEEWFRRFYAVSVGSRWPARTSDLVLKLHDQFKAPPSPDPLKPSESSRALPAEGKASLEETLQAYLGYMAHVMPKEQRPGQQQINWNIEGLRRKQCEPQILWVNALISRLFWDFLREQHWCDKMREKLQKKLSKIHVPYFINELTVTGIELGSEVPFINRASKPYLDDRGLWVDLDILYQGGFCMILETKCNLMKLKKDVSAEDKIQPLPNTRSAWTDSDEEDSAESSTDEEEDKANPDPTTSDDGKNPTGGGQRKFLRIVDRITQSKYFQQATEYKYIKRAMEGVSNTRLELKVELRRLCGTMAVNIPHPPSDRIWYGFRSPPHFNLSAVPKVGEREFNVSQITDWIEKKLTLEFQRAFVYPNMDDLVIPLMCDSQTSR